MTVMNKTRFLSLVSMTTLSWSNLKTWQKCLCRILRCETSGFNGATFDFYFEQKKILYKCGQRNWLTFGGVELMTFCGYFSVLDLRFLNSCDLDLRAVWRTVNLILDCSETTRTTRDQQTGPTSVPGNVRCRLMDQCTVDEMSGRCSVCTRFVNQGLLMLQRIQDRGDLGLSQGPNINFNSKRVTLACLRQNRFCLPRETGNWATSFEDQWGQTPRPDGSV